MSFTCAYVSLVNNEAYLPGILVLHQSLRSVCARYPLVAMVTPLLPIRAKDLLRQSGIELKEVDLLLPGRPDNSSFEHDTRFLYTWTKLRAFEIDHYDRVILLDSDMLVLRNMDELAEIDISVNHIAAAHVCACNPRKLKHYPEDWIPCNCAYTSVTHPLGAPAQPDAPGCPRPHTQLNSGTVVLQPSKELMNEIIHFLATDRRVPGFTFPDQDFLSIFFAGKWKPLPWYYNALKTLRAMHPQLWENDELRCLHYILHDKPWHSRAMHPDCEKDYGDMHRWWWDHFDALGAKFSKDDPEGWNLILANVDSVDVYHTHPS